MHLDTPTVSFVTVLVVCLECGILTALWMIHRNMKGVAYWAVGAMAIAIGMLGFFLRGSIPPFISIVTANIFIIGGFILTWWGIEAFFDRRLPYRLGLAILGLSGLGLVYFALIEPNTRIRSTLLLCVLALMSALRLYSLIRDIRPGTRFSQTICAAVYGCQLVNALALAAALFFSPPSDRPFMQLPLSGWILLVLMLLSLAAVFAAILLVNETIAARLQEAARRDALTDALNRRALDEAAESEISRSQRHGLPLSLLTLDIDHFKSINDRYGHPTGDDVLRRFAAATRHCLRREDLLGRIGGEEFCALLPNTAAAGAALLAERIRTAIAELPIDIDGEPLSLRVSIGVATLGVNGTEWPELMRQADDALYAAKRAGRNSVAIAGPKSTG